MKRIYLLGILLVVSCVTGKSIPGGTPSVLVRGGTFVFGSSKPCPQDFKCDDIVNATAKTKNLKAIYPPMEVTVEDFYIDAHEVTNAQYEYCVEMGVCPQKGFNTFPAAKGVDYNHDPTYNNFPAVGITYEQARIYCDFVGKRLPTEFEWELVASGDHLVKSGEDIAKAEAEKQAFPNNIKNFADNYNKSCNGIQIPGCPSGSGLMPSPVESNTNDFVKLAAGKVYDLTGNVSEWVRGIPVEPDGDTVNNVNCKSDLPSQCKDPHWCFNPACSTDQTPPPNDCPDLCYANNNISECQSTSDKPIFRMCQQSGFQGIPICEAYQEPVTQEDLFKKFENNNEMLTKTVVRGCSYSNNCWGYSTNDNNFICGTRSSARHILNIKTEDKTTDPQIGFRCAADTK